MMVKSEIALETTYPVMESFYTIQGEGYYQGKAAFFIRLGGCDVGCFWCDVKDSWDASIHPHKSVQSIVEEASMHPARMAVITGGEPLLHDCGPLTAALKDAGFQTNIETSGSSVLSGTWHWICLSPKKFKRPLPAILPVANELKVIIYNKSDFDWAEEFAHQVNSECKLYLQPEWEQSPRITPQIVEYIKQHPRWEFSLQIHKYMEVP